MEIRREIRHGLAAGRAGRSSRNQSRDRGARRCEVRGHPPGRIALLRRAQNITASRLGGNGTFATVLDYRSTYIARRFDRAKPTNIAASLASWLSVGRQLPFVRE